MFGALMAYVGMVQQIFGEVFHRASLMPTMFALCAVIHGRGRISRIRGSSDVWACGAFRTRALLVYIAVTALHVAIAALGWSSSGRSSCFRPATMATFSLSVSNFGAMAMEPVAAVAGIGASLQGFISTGGAAIVGAVIGREFNGTTLPLAAGSLCCGFIALGFVLAAERGRLFRQHHAGAA